MKREKLPLLILILLFLATMLNVPISNYSTPNSESVANSKIKENSNFLDVGYTIYKNETKFYAVNNKLQKVEFESENFSEIINQVLSFVEEGSIITISPGEYTISTTMKLLKPIHIRAYGVTFQVNASSTPIAIQIGNENNPIFKLHSFKGARILNIGEKGMGTGVLLYNSHFGVLEDVEVWFFGFAIYSKGSWDYTVKNCILRVNKVGIKLDQDEEGVNRSNQFRISGGYIGCETGIHITANCQNVIIEAVNICDSSETGAGVWIEHAEHTIIKECYFENNLNTDIKIGGEKSQATVTQIEKCFFLVKKTAIKIGKSFYTRIEGCMAINDSGNDHAFFVYMAENAIKLIYTYNYVQNLENNLYFGHNGLNVEFIG